MVALNLESNILGDININYDVGNVVIVRAILLKYIYQVTVLVDTFYVALIVYSCHKTIRYSCCKTDADE